MSKKESDFNIILYKRGDNQFELSSNSLYQVIPKFDADAVDGFQAERTTKILDPEAGVTTVNLAVWDAAREVYDTGMTEYSAALTRLYPNIEARRVVLREITKHILNPMIQRKGNVFDPNNLEFWDNESFDLSVDHIFNTEKVEDLYKMYLLVLHGNLAPTEFESDPAFKNSAQYSVENKESVIDLKHKKELELNKATAMFFTMLTSSRAELIALLDWMKISTQTEIDDALLNSVFTRWLKEDINQNPRQFLELYENMIKSPSGKRELEMYSNLVQLRKSGKIKQAFNTITLDGEDLGSSLKDVTKKVLADEELTTRIMNLLD